MFMMMMMSEGLSTDFWSLDESRFLWTRNILEYRYLFLRALRHLWPILSTTLLVLYCTSAAVTGLTARLSRISYAI